MKQVVPQLAVAAGEVEGDDLVVGHRGQLPVVQAAGRLQVIPRRRERLGLEPGEVPVGEGLQPGSRASRRRTGTSSRSARASATGAPPTRRRSAAARTRPRPARGSRSRRASARSRPGCGGRSGVGAARSGPSRGSVRPGRAISSSHRSSMTQVAREADQAVDQEGPFGDVAGEGQAGLDGPDGLVVLPLGDLDAGLESPAGGPIAASPGRRGAARSIMSSRCSGRV